MSADFVASEMFPAELSTPAAARRFVVESLRAAGVPVADALPVVVSELVTNSVLHAASKGDSVIVGRGSQLFLKDRPDTLRVFLYAPREQKVRRLLARGKSEKEAHERVDTVDRERAGFIEKYFHVEWPDRAVYHLMINTAIGDETVVQTIVAFLKEFDSKQPQGKTNSA